MPLCLPATLLEKVMKTFISFIKNSWYSPSAMTSVIPHDLLTHSWLTYILHNGYSKSSHSPQAYHYSFTLPRTLLLTRLTQSQLLEVSSFGFLFLHLRVSLPHHSGLLPSFIYFECYPSSFSCPTSPPELSSDFYQGCLINTIFITSPYWLFPLCLQWFSCFSYSKTKQNSK